MAVITLTHADRCPRLVALAGDGAGGTVAAVITRRLRDENGPRLRVRALGYPMCDVGLDPRSADEFAEGYGSTRAAMRRFWELHLGRADARHPDASPLRAAHLGGAPRRA